MHYCVDISQQLPTSMYGYLKLCFVYKCKIRWCVNIPQLSSPTSRVRADAGALFFWDNTTICIIDYTYSLWSRVQTEEKSKQHDDDICSSERIASCLRD